LHTQLGEDVAQMHFDRVWAEEERRRDVFVGRPARREARHFQLALGERLAWFCHEWNFRIFAGVGYALLGVG
jgi:hypothetical protein